MRKINHKIKTPKKQRLLGDQYVKLHVKINKPTLSKKKNNIFDANKSTYSMQKKTTFLHAT